MPKPPTPRKPAPAHTRRPAAPPSQRPHAPHHAEEHRKLFRVAGLAAVSALFEREPQRVERLFFDERLKDAVGAICQRLARARRPYRMVDGEELARVAGTPMHGGVVALIEPRPVPAFDPEAARRWAADKRPLLILDGVGNPHNLGAIVRTAAFFGFPRLILSDHPAQALPSEAGYRVAEGGFEWLEVYRAERFVTALKRLKGAYRVVGTALSPHARPPAALAPSKDGRPVALVLGNEEEGLPPATLAACEEVVMIPGAGHVQSLNVAATAAILFHALSSAESLRLSSDT
ncbi:TrmH family RNA methyltransferase [Azospirillum sp.]|uniref:TrmH family RNA methyltransferase n=1 Tax=Azospirillum sp. TaxID=34012 RepID=UPI003D704085